MTDITEQACLELVKLIMEDTKVKHTNIKPIYNDN